MAMPEARDSFTLGETIINPGETRNIRLAVSESYVSTPIEIPVTIVNGIQEGPVVAVTAASHGDECNGTAIVRQLVYGVDHSSLRGVLVCAPVLNLPGFLRNERDLPDGRDLNRNFPGKPDGNSAQRYAHILFTGLIRKCNFLLDLHTAGRGRSNLLQVRGDIENVEVRRLAKAFGSEIVIDEPGLQGTLRRAATEAGVAAITAEIGESQRFEKELVQAGLEGVLNVLFELGMLKGKPRLPSFQVIVKRTEWVRADRGGILEMHASPRSLVSEGKELCTITNPFGKEVGSVKVPFNGMVVGITTYPMVSPGSPICHLVKLDRTLATVEAALRKEEEIKRARSEGRPPDPNLIRKGNGKEKKPEERKIEPPMTPSLGKQFECQPAPGEAASAAPALMTGDGSAEGTNAKQPKRDGPEPDGDRESRKDDYYYEDYDSDAEPEEKE